MAEDIHPAEPHPRAHKPNITRLLEPRVVEHSFSRRRYSSS
jgi:hypothetical protein